ncbi:MAG TPA: hypothetical protein VF329_00265 [Gammaproteobacteria bacterium]
MPRSLRHKINALICVLIAAHAVYWFATGRMETATSLRTGLVVAQAVVGAIGAIWFWRRARAARD